MKLWQESQLTMNFTSPKFSVPQTERFKLQSIYWPDKVEKKKVQGREVEDVHAQAIKISKLIDEEERLARGVKRIEKRSKTNVSPQKYHRSAETSPAKYEALPMRQTKIVSRLFVKQPKGRSPNSRDKFGFLNWEIMPEEQLLQQQQALEQESEILEANGKIQESMRTTSYSRRLAPETRGFSRGHRLDLSRPENFYPGPGSYRIVRYLDGQRLHRR